MIDKNFNFTVILLALWFLSIPLSTSIADILFVIIIITSFFNNNVSLKKLFNIYRYIIIFIIIIFIISLFSDNILYSIFKWKRILIWLIFFPLESSNIDIKKINKILYIFVIEIFLIALYSLTAKNFDDIGRLCLNNNIIQLHPGLLASYFSIAFLIILYHLSISKKQNYLTTTFNIFVFITLGYSIFKTQSRISLLVLILIFLLLVIKIKNINYKKFFLIFFIIGVIGIAFISKYRLMTIPSPDMPSIRIRYHLWKMGINIWKDRPLFGLYGNKIDSIYMDYAHINFLRERLWNDFHSDYIQMLVSYGLLGIISYLLIFKNIALAGLLNKIQNRFIFLTILIILIIIFSGTTQAMLFNAKFNRILAFFTALFYYFVNKNKLYNAKTGKKTL